MQIFISYSRVDKAFAQRLADDMTKSGYQLWLDLRSIAHGANWDMEVQRGLDNSDVMLVLLTPASSASQNVADEWSYFIEKNKKILPLLVQPCDVPFRLSRRQRIDFVQGYEQGFGELLKALSEPAAATGDGSRPLAAETTSKSLRVSWADRYHWWNGLRPKISSGDAAVTQSELRLIAPQQFPFLIPLTSLVSAQMMRLPWDTYLSLTFLDRADQSHTLALMGTARTGRQAAQFELLNLLKLYSGRSLEA